MKSRLPFLIFVSIGLIFCWFAVNAESWAQDVGTGEKEAEEEEVCEKGDLECLDRKVDTMNVGLEAVLKRLKNMKKAEDREAAAEEAPE